MEDRQRGTARDPHGGGPVLHAGRPPEEAQAALVLLHGRGSTAQEILSLAQALSHPAFAYLAPQAADNTWYPQRFTAPLEANNEPWLSSALAAVGSVLAGLAAAGIAPERIMLLGFSQGACLALEFAARHARRYGGVVGLSGGLIGQEGTPRDYPGSLEGAPIFLGCGTADNHIAEARVRHSAEVLRRLGAEVDMRLYPGMGHTINQEEIAVVRQMMSALVPGAARPPA